MTPMSLFKIGPSTASFHTGLGNNTIDFQWIRAHCQNRRPEHLPLDHHHHGQKYSFDLMQDYNNLPIVISNQVFKHK